MGRFGTSTLFALLLSPILWVQVRSISNLDVAHFQPLLLSQMHWYPTSGLLHCMVARMHSVSCHDGLELGAMWCRCVTLANIDTERLCCCAELMVGGSLSDAMRMHRTFTLRRAMEVAIDTARGLAYLHAKKNGAIIHRWAVSHCQLLDQMTFLSY